MSWTKHFSIIKSAPAIPQIDNGTQAYSTTTARTSSWLNIAYQGNPQRIPRYYQFQEMDSDSDINTALDTIVDFCTQSEEQTEEPFDVQFNGEPNESETKIIKQMLARWIKINSLRSRLWYMFRDTIKNGDAFFLRDPETQEWLWLDHFMVELVKVDETKGKVPDEYIVRGLDYNRQAKFGTKQADPNAYRTPFGTTTIGGARPMATGTSGPAQFNMAVQDGMIRTEVADTGHGLTERANDELFMPFTSTKATGLGVGLSISRSIIESHYGTIWAEANPGGGAKFCFTLPLASVERGEFES